jgi:nucleoside 2-deoxyribosyltransferase
MPTNPCVICHLPDQATGNGELGLSSRTSCLRCGDFQWGITAPFEGRSRRQVRMSGYVRDQNAAGVIPMFTAELVRLVESLPLPRIVERSRRLLAKIARDWGQNNNVYPIDGQLDLEAVSYSADKEELAFLFRLLESEGLVELKHGSAARITPNGFIEAELLELPRTASAQGFVAMSFDPTMAVSYSEGFSIGISTAGYRPLRIDGKEHINSISDEILAEIRRSRFVVADYTHINNGVYFEAGFAIGLGIPVIPTSRTDHIDKLHFDVRHINTLQWDDPAQLAQKLSARISAVIGDGPLRQTAN